MPEFLGGVGVDPPAERLYRRILRGDRTTLDAHAERLGWSLHVASDALAALLDAGLVREDTDGALVPADPRIAITRLVEAVHEQIAERTAALAAARDAIGQFAADHEAGLGNIRQPMWEVVPSDLAGGVVGHAVSQSQGAVLSSVVSVDWSPDGIENALTSAAAVIASGRPMRSLYPMDVVDSPDQLAWMARFAAIGEEQRLTSGPLTEFAVFGSEIVLAVAEWGRVASDIVQIRDPMLVAMFSTLFELAWSAGLPVPGGARDDDSRLLALLAAGYKDEAIARYLGVALRTVRRHVARLMDEHGVDTRFQLGMAAERAGLLTSSARRGGRVLPRR